MQPSPSELLDVICKEDVQAFLAEALAIIEPGRELIPSWHIEHVCWLLNEVTRGAERRVIFNLPPRSLKSLLISVVYPAFRLGQNPRLRIVVASNTIELARKHAADFRRLTQSPFFRRLFPRYALANAGDRLLEQKTTLNGHRIATSIGTNITGHGADLIIVDDPNRAKDVYSEAQRKKVNAYFDLELYTRLNDKAKDSIIIVMQRLHADDLVGHVTAGRRWTVSAIPAKATDDVSYRVSAKRLHRRVAGDILLPTQYNDEVLDDLRATLGSLGFEAQYQQSPTPADGAVIKREWVKYYDQPPATFDLVVASWDPATTIEENSDYSAGTVWGRRGQDFYLLDVKRGKYEAPDLRRLIERTHLEYEAHATVIEKAGIGDALGQDMRRSSSIRPILLPVTVDKQSRLLAQAPKFEAGQVWLPREATWLGSYLNEILAFPTGRNDDQVDSTSQALKYLTRRTPAVATQPATRPRSFSRPRGRTMRPG